MTLKAGSCDVQKVYVGACEIKRIYVGSCVIYDATSIVGIAFWGITPDPDTYVMLDVKDGTPPIEDARVADLELPDYEGVYQTFGEELGYEKVRTVTNLLTVLTSSPANSSDDITNVKKGGTSLAFVDGSTEITVTSDSAAFARWFNVGTSDYFVEGDRPSFSFEAKGVGAAIGKELALSANSNGVTNQTAFQVCTLTSEWKRFALNRQAFPAGISELYLLFDVNNNEGTLASGDVLHVRNLQVENYRDIAQQNPSEYKYVEAGNDDISEYYGSANRHTIDVDGVVVEGSVTPLDENPWLVHAPEATNLCEDSTGSTWSKSNVVITDDQEIGVTGQVGSALKVADQSATSQGFINYGVSVAAADATLISILFFVKKQAVDTTAFPAMFLSIGGSQARMQWNPETGDRTTWGLDEGRYNIVSDGDWWRICCEVDVVAASSIIWRLYPSQGTWGAADNAAIGDFILSDGIGIFADTPISELEHLPPIYTSGQAATRDKSDITIPIVNHSDEGDYYEFDVIVTGPCNVLDIFLQFDGTDFILTDGTNEQRLPGTIGTAHTIRIDYSKELLTMTLSVDGVPTAGGAYTGALRRDMLKVFKDSPYVGKIREVKREGAAWSDAFIMTWRTTVDAETIALPLYTGYTYNMLVDWGDGSSDTITAWDQLEATHEYALAGDYEVSITGQCDAFRFQNGGDKLKIIEIKQWGAVQFTYMAYAFWGCSNMVISATDVLDVTLSTSFLQGFYGCSSAGKIPQLTAGAPGAGRNYGFLFSSMGATSYPEFLDLSQAGSQSSMLLGLQAAGAIDLSNWIPSPGSDMRNAYRNFTYATSILLPSGCKALSYREAFMGAPLLELINLGGDTGDSLITSGLIDTFNGLSSLHTVVGIEDLVTSSQVYFRGTFKNATLMNPDVSGWDITSLSYAEEFMLGTSFSATNYDKLLLSWSQQNFQSNVTAHFGTATYQEEEAKQILVDAGWIITDGGLKLPLYAFTPDPDTAVMQDLRFGTPPVTDARTMDLNAQDQSGVYNAFGLELPYELGEVTGELNSRVVTAVEGEAPIQLFDSFDNDNGTALTDHTPDIDVNGQGWVVLNGSMVLVGDACNTEAANSHASIDIGIMDVDIEEQVFIYDEWAGFSLRVQDHDNCIVAYLHVDGIMEIGEFVGGVYATLNSSTGHTVGYQQTHDVRVTQVGDDITLYFDGAELSVTTTRFPGVTSIGLRSGLATAQLGGAKWLDVTVHAEAEIEVPWLVHAPEATNALAFSRDMSQWVNTVNQSDLTSGQPGIYGDTGAYISTDSNASSYSNRTLRIVRSDNTYDYSFSVYVKKTAAQHYPGIGILNSNASDEAYITVNTFAGILVDRVGRGNFDSSNIEDVGDFYKITLSGDITTVMSNGMDIVLYPSVDQNGDGNWSAAAIGSTLFDACAFYSDIAVDIAKDLPPIYTSGQAATRDSSEIAIPSINHSDAGDRYTLDVIVTGGPCNVLSTFLQYDGTDFILTDGTNECRVTAAIGQHSIQIDYSADNSTMSLTVDGGAAVASSYAGVLLHLPFKAFMDSPYVGKIRNVKRKGPEKTLLLYDTFTDVDGTLLHEHTTDNGLEWTPLVGELEIVDGKTQVKSLGSNNAICLRDVGETDYRVDAHVALHASNTSTSIWVRTVDFDNAWLIYISNIIFRIYEKTNGTLTIRGTGSFGPGFDVTDTHVHVEVVGTTIRAWVDDYYDGAIEYASAIAHSTSTNFGVAGDSSIGRSRLTAVTVYKGI